jgi:hypothetical protein
MKIKLVIIVALFGLFTTCFGQQRTTCEKWNWLVGEWVGEGSGQPGQGSGFFTFKTDLDNNILVRKDHTEIVATENKPKVIHDLRIIYPGNSGSSTKAIYYDNE